LTAAALDGVRIIDLTDKSCVYATKILSDLGAEVIRVEPTGGDPMRHYPPIDQKTGESMFHAFMNVNKSSVTIDLDTPDGQDMFRRLVKSAAIVVESRRPGEFDGLGIGFHQLAPDHPELVWTSITPFGSDGPYANWTMDDLVAQAMGGLMTLSGWPSREPLRLFGEQTCYIAGLHAASGTLMAYWHVLMTGEGQHVDVSIQDCVAHTLENAIQYYTAEGTVRARQKGRAEPGAGVFQCADGEIFLMAGISMISSSWHNLTDMMVADGIPGATELKDEKWLDPVFRKTPEAQQAANAIITSFTMKHGKNQLYDRLQQNHILSAPMNQVGDLFENAQLKFLNWFSEQPWDDRSVVWPGPPVRLSETPRRSPVRVAATGADNERIFADLGAPPALRQVAGGRA
jgi:crotonobetainyl-CoA:carnitine CoA-transferase CaiB-like acyl-CoA transferase